MANQTEQQILEVARRHFVQKGYAGARMQEIADDAGINKAMLHYYFRSKERLYDQVIQDTLDMLLPRLAAAIGGGGTFFERLEQMVSVYIDTLLEHPEIPVFLMSELSGKRAQFVEKIKQRAGHFPAIQSFLGQAVLEMEAGHIRRFPPAHLILNIVGMTVFPFMAKPVFCTIMNFPEANFEALMRERKTLIVQFIRDALRV
ncbi:MAG: TetR/AcrR family transcriptional regulator [Bacteroidetes bacterium]|nr:MAG: TetR/AcrR family transcriptional regulator [Bacteroidota bacterium]